MAIFEAVTAGLSLFEGALNAGSARKAARAQMASIDNEITALNEQRTKLESAFTARRGIVRDMFGNKVNSLMDTVGNSLEDINADFESASRKSGLAFSGDLETRASEAGQRSKSQFKFNRNSLIDNLQSSMIELDVKETEQIGGINTRIESLRGERSIAEDQSKKRFLGIF